MKNRRFHKPFKKSLKFATKVCILNQSSQYVAIITYYSIMLLQIGLVK
jgi:hypothetical protein